MNAFLLNPKNRAKSALFIFLVANFLLVSCSEQTSENTTTPSSESTVSTSTSSTSYSESGSSIASSDGVTVKTIKVASNCIGCGKCARMDSTHFQMNRNTHKAEAIQTSGNDSALERAIKHCPVDAISAA